MEFDLEALAFFCKEEFSSLSEKEKHCSIVICGGTKNQRRKVADYLIPQVDVFVYTREQFPDFRPQYRIPLDNYLEIFKLSKAS
jgi:hypothetical protein